jgi:parvulin-like peptidyl-prolyl isomerase
MFRFFRKHSWILYVVIGVTILSFIYFMNTGPSRGRGNGGAADYGSLYGHTLTEEEVNQARNDFSLYYLLNNGAWPEKDPSITPLQIAQRAYVNLLFDWKAKSLGVVVPDQVVISEASDMLNSPSFNRAMGNKGSKAMQMDEFVQHVLQPYGLNAGDFEHFIRSQLVMDQLRLSLGLSGALVTPQEAGTLYDHDHQEVSAQVAFFSASNYLDRVSAPPAAVGEFFTNYMAYYREPDRVQVNYIWLNLTNYIAQSKAEWAKTNFEQVVENNYRGVDPAQYGDAKTPEAMKARFRDLLIRQRAYSDAALQAKDFVAALFAKDPVKLENFVTVAKEKGLQPRLSAPLAQDGTTEEFAHAPDLAKAAFTLTPDSPFSDAMPGEDGIYIIGLAAQLPSSVPSFDAIQSRVTRDFKVEQAVALARQAGTNFYYAAAVQLAAGQTFARAATAKGITPVILAPFSLSSSDIPEIEGHSEIAPFRQVAFSTPPGRVSQFVPTQDGGYVLFVKSVSPADAAVKAADMPQYLSQIRRGRENEAFNMWVNNEANREFRNIPYLQQLEPQAKQP